MPYPRFGERLAPQSLADILAIPVQGAVRDGKTAVLNLAQLDESSWQEFPDCARLAGEIVRAVSAAVPHLPDSVLNRALPVDEFEGVDIANLDIDVRTYNILTRWGKRNTSQLYGLTIQDVLNQRNAGAKTLVDLLSALESVQKHPGSFEMRDVRTEHAKTERSERRRRRLVRVFQEWARSMMQSAASQISNRDPRLGALVRRLDSKESTLANALRSKMNEPFPELFLPTLRQIRQRVRHVGEQTLEEELLEISRYACPKANLKPILRCLGFDGRGGTTLQVAGDESNITRERVRQLIEKYRKCVPTNTFTPVLDRALKEVSTLLPRSADAVEAELLRHKMTGKGFDLESLARVASFFEKTREFSIVGSSPNRLAISKDGGVTDRELQSINALARRLCAKQTVAPVAQIHARAREIGTNVSVESIVAILSTDPAVIWLDVQKTWLWIPGGRSRLLNQVDKVMAVAGQLHVGELRDAVNRFHRMKSAAPPKKILLELLKHCKEFQIENETIIWPKPPKWERVLSETELTMANILAQHGGIMARERLEELCRDAEIKRSTFYVFLGYSPIICGYGPGIYGLRGASVPAGLVESLKTPVNRGKTVVDYGWTGAGNFWIAYRCSEYIVLSAILSVPAACLRFVDGKFGIWAGGVDTRR